LNDRKDIKVAFIAVTGQVIANFVLKFANFLFLWQQESVLGKLDKNV